MRKYIVFIIFALNISFFADAMRLTKKNALRGVKAAAFSVMSVPFLYRAYKTYNEAKNNDQHFGELPDMPEVVKSWVKTELKGHISSTRPIMLKIRDYSNEACDWDWGAGDGKIAIMVCDKNHIDELAKVLTSRDKNMNSSVTSDEQKIIDTNSWLVKHEIGHLRGKHTKKKIVAYALAPFAVQAVCSTMNHGAKKIFGMNSIPKTIPGLIGRSSLALVGIIPRLYMGIAGLFLYNRHREWQADRYACKHAKTKQELTVARDYFQGLADRLKNVFCNNKISDKKIFDEVFIKDRSDLQKIVICESIAPRIHSLGRELFEDGDNIVQVKKNHPFKYRYFKFLLRSAHFVFDQDHPWYEDRADAIGKALKKFDQKK